MSTQIKIKAVAVMLNRTRTHHLVQVGEAPEAPFHRLLGGNLDFGETLAECVVREILEETGQRLQEPELLAYFENRFELHDEPRHELLFVFHGRVALDDVVPPEGGWMTEGERSFRVEWRPVDDRDLDVPLYPSDLGPLVRQAAGRRG